MGGREGVPSPAFQAGELNGWLLCGWGGKL